MTFELVKVEKTEVSIDFDVLYEAVKNDFSASPDEYDSISEYNEDISEFFTNNCTVFLHDVFGLNFDEDDDGPYYDIESNDGTLDDICDEFENYIFEKRYEQ
jgi:hypothetical protein